LLARLPLPAKNRFQEARDRLDSTIYRIINERRASGNGIGIVDGEYGNGRAADISKAEQLGGCPLKVF